MSEKANNVTFEQALEYIVERTKYLSSPGPRYFEILREEYERLQIELEEANEQLETLTTELDQAREALAAMEEENDADLGRL